MGGDDGACKIVILNVWVWCLIAAIGSRADGMTSDSDIRVGRT